MTTTRILPRALSARTAALAATSLAAFGLLAAPLGTAAPAHAHDELIDQQIVLDEADGSAEAVALTFSNDVLDVGTEIVVTGPEGDATDGAPVTNGPDVTQALADDLALGDYQVAWRVVSSDGHPIDGTFEFTVQEDAIVSPDPRFLEGHEHEEEGESGSEAADSADTGDTEAGDAEAGSTDASEAQASDEGLSLGALIGIAVAASLLAVGATVVAIVSMRRKRAALEAGAGPEGATGSANTGSANTDADGTGTTDTGTDAADTEEDAK